MNLNKPKENKLPDTLIEEIGNKNKTESEIDTKAKLQDVIDLLSHLKTLKELTEDDKTQLMNSKNSSTEQNMKRSERNDTEDFSETKEKVNLLYYYYVILFTFSKECLVYHFKHL